MPIVYQCVLAQLQYGFAVHGWSRQLVLRDEVCGLGQEPAEVGVVGRVSAWTYRGAYRRPVRSRCEGLLLLAPLEIARAWAATPP